MVLLKNLRPPTEGVRLQQADTAAVLDGHKLGNGTLYVAETRLSWFDGAGLGFCLEYPTIGLHAISRDVSAYPQEHLYVMVNGKLSEENEAEMAEKPADEDDDGVGSEEEEDDDDDDGGDNEEQGGITEIRFVPDDKAALESMFAAMCECQALHPDPEDEDDSDDDDFEGEEYDVEEAEAGKNIRHQLQRCRLHGDVVRLKLVYLPSGSEHGHADVPTFYTCDEGLSALTQEGRATLDRLEGMLAQSAAHTFNMGGVRTEHGHSRFEDGMEVDGDASAEAGQFEDADVDH
ncbi:methylosome subunit pICln isoform X2 [Festucalex cinctus]